MPGRRLELGKVRVRHEGANDVIHGQLAPAHGGVDLVNGLLREPVQRLLELVLGKFLTYPPEPGDEQPPAQLGILIPKRLARRTPDGWVVETFVSRKM